VERDSGAAQHPRAQRSQPLALLLGALIPITGNILYIFDLSPVEGVDLTPFLLTITGVLYLLAVLRYRLFDIRRVARTVIVEKMRDGMLIIDEKQRVVDINPSALHLLGIPKTSKEWDMSQMLANAPAILKLIQHPQPQPVTIAMGDPPSRHLDVQVTELRDSLDNPVGKLVMLRDVTERLIAEKVAFESAIEQHRHQLLTPFIQDISHEFRTPLSIINTSLYLMERMTGSAQQKERRDLIQLQTKRLDLLISEMLISVQLDSSAILEPMPIHLNHLLNALTQDFQATFDSKQQSLKLDLPDEPLNVTGDLFMLQKALANILNNASRYTAAGGSITLSAHTGDPVAITISDTGMGMTPETQARIFERFYRADEAHSTPGFGLGLSIAQSIIEKHQGNINVQSQVGEGTTFTIRLPQTSTEAIAIPSQWLKRASELPNTAR
jgi:signal transduction histidine kinase